MSGSTSRMYAKLSRIVSGDYTPKDFIIADAKDGDMGGGAEAVGLEERSVADLGKIQIATPMTYYRDSMKEMVESDLVDIMLMSLSSAEALAKEAVFTDSKVTPAIRLNDATDIWGYRGACYRKKPSVAFKTATIERAVKYSKLGLYSITFYNDLEKDIENLEAYSRFRDLISRSDMDHFLEVFNPAFAIDTGDEDLGAYINDSIVRCLAGVDSLDRPLFLKIQYNGAKAMAELAEFDPTNLVVGILGGGAGTTRDTFELIEQANRFGARVALFGRKIYKAEDSIEIVKLMRRIVESDLSPKGAVKLYHDSLEKKTISPSRSLEDDLEITDSTLIAEAK
jgi:hypothetical protein